MIGYYFEITKKVNGNFKNLTIKFFLLEISLHQFNKKFNKTKIKQNSLLLIALSFLNGLKYELKNKKLYFKLREKGCTVKRCLKPKPSLERIKFYRTR